MNKNDLNKVKMTEYKGMGKDGKEVTVSLPTDKMFLNLPQTGNAEYDFTNSTSKSVTFSYILPMEVGFVASQKMEGKLIGYTATVLVNTSKTKVSCFLVKDDNSKVMISNGSAQAFIKVLSELTGISNGQADGFYKSINFTRNDSTKTGAKGKVAVEKIAKIEL